MTQAGPKFTMLLRMTQILISHLQVLASQVCATLASQVCAMLGSQVCAMLALWCWSDPGLPACLFASYQQSFIPAPELFIFKYGTLQEFACHLCVSTGPC